MRTIFLSLIVMISAMTTLNAQSYVVDANKSTLQWHGKKVTGEHDGFIKLKDGSIEIMNEQISKGRFVIDMTSITNTDITDAATNQKLVGHLKSDDFFGVANHPEAVIEIVKSSKFVNNEATVDANLTIKKITHPITFKAKRNGSSYTAEIVVDRAKYDVRYGSGSFFDGLGDKMIYDDFTLKVKLETKPAGDKNS